MLLGINLRHSCVLITNSSLIPAMNFPVIIIIIIIIIIIVIIIIIIVMSPCFVMSTF